MCAGTGLVLVQPLSESPRFKFGLRAQDLNLGCEPKLLEGPNTPCDVVSGPPRPCALVLPDKKVAEMSRCAMATSLFPSSSSPHLSIFELKPFAPLKSAALSSPAASSLSTSSQRSVRSGSSVKAPERNPRAGRWRLRAAAEDAVEGSQQIVSSGGDDGVSNVVSVLLFIAFVGLSILTIGVVYIAVTDFLQKREREKFEKEDAGKKKKKGGKKGKVRARAGPRGFGQRIEDEDGDDS